MSYYKFNQSLLSLHSHDQVASILIPQSLIFCVTFACTLHCHKNPKLTFVPQNFTFWHFCCQFDIFSGRRNITYIITLPSLTFTLWTSILTFALHVWRLVLEKHSIEILSLIFCQSDIFGGRKQFIWHNTAKFYNPKFELLFCDFYCQINVQCKKHSMIASTFRHTYYEL